MFLTSKQKLGSAALIMGASVFVSRLMGLLRDKIISWQFGASGDTDIYFAAFVVPDFLNYLLAGGYVSITLIPMLSGRFEEDTEDAWKLFGTVFCWCTLAIALLSAIAWIFAPFLSGIVAPGFDAAQSERLLHYLRIILPGQVFFLPGACLTAILYMRRQFQVPGLIPLVYNGCILLLGTLLPALGIVHGMEGFCWGVLLGAALGGFFLPLQAVREGGLTLNISFKHPLMGKFLILALPLMVGQSVVVLDEQFVRIFGSLADGGSVSLLSYARRIMMVPVGVVAQAAGVASFPFLASLAAKGDMESFRATLGNTTRNSIIIAIPMVVWMSVAAAPILGFIFEGGNFSTGHTVQATPLLQLMLFAVPFWLLQQVTGRAFYALNDTLTPAIIGTVATLAAMPCYFALIPLFGASAVALVTTLSVAAYAMILLAVARRRFAADAFKEVPKAAVFSALLSLPAGALAYAIIRFGFGYLAFFHPLIQQFIVLGASGIAFCTVWLLLARLLVPAYFNIVLSPVLRRIKK